MDNQVRGRSIPLNPDLLFLQSLNSHRSYSIFTEKISSDALIKPRRCDLTFWQHISDLPNERINARVEGYLNAKGLGLVCKLGEATITLQDVQILWGLPIDGPPVTGIWHSMEDAQWRQLVTQYLGIADNHIAEADIQTGKIKISCLINELNREVVEIEERIQQRARVYMLALMGGVLFSYANAHDVPLNYIWNIIDLSPEPRLSWGSAVLAHLYRNLCRAAQSEDAKSINGATLLLQHWAYERIQTLAPKLRHDVLLEPPLPNGMGQPPLKERMFCWCPYDDNLQSRLPDECLADRELWSYRSPIIFWSTIELHLPDRVNRRFGWIQDIPNSDMFTQEMHRIVHNTSLKSKQNADLTKSFPQVNFLPHWRDRHQHLHRGVDGLGTVADYFQWYNARTVTHITNPGNVPPANTYPRWAGTTNVYEEGLMRIRRHALTQMQPDSQPNPQPFLDIPNQIFNYT
ncbi:serine/threonine-protein phosphatase 7 long form homolog [Rutidosis leptorrhynchoides]|uniref:serine/threonine-protein phosphatase 7 long form homolog n=1 Tax=Rutidosis leptorrhynchoides TaxID=125765 RepID=UPI003A99B0C3